MIERDPLAALKAENARLIALLEQQGIAWRLPAAQVLLTNEVKQTRNFSTQEKVAIFRRLFRGRTDVYPLRWESRASGKAGYSPACANEWRAGVCDKPRIKCGDCGNRLLVPLTDAVIYDHLAGEHTVGVYPLLEDDCCYFLAVDFDEEQWQDDVRDARRLGTALISHACARTRQLKLTSYDRLFPNQDSMPKGGFGNLIALPLQKRPRESGRSVFVNGDLQPYADQWAFLAAIQPMSVLDIEPTVLRATGKAHPLDVTFIDDEDLATPWKSSAQAKKKLSGPLPKSLSVTLSNMIYFEKAQLPQALANRLIRLAAFQNPEFYKAQAMRMSVWDKPRIIGNAENFPKHIALPRDCLDAARALLKDNGNAWEIQDERFSGEPLDADFTGRLRLDQETTAAQMMQHDAGVLCAPTAFGKTVIAAALIAKRGVNTLVQHRLMRS